MLVVLFERQRQLLADTFVLYFKTKNFHWRMTGQHFRDYHLLLDEHAEQIFAVTADIAERARKIGGTTIRSIGDISLATARSARTRVAKSNSCVPRTLLLVATSPNTWNSGGLKAH
jgi:DNA-binding ferritin-like protein